MKNLLFLLAVIALFSCDKEEVQSEPIEGLQAITSLSQMTTELESGVSMVFFHASWCSVCQAQRPAVIEAAMDISLSNVYFGEVEYEDYPDIVDANDVEGFPTIVIYNDGAEVERFLGGGHSAETIKTAILNQL